MIIIKSVLRNLFIIRHRTIKWINFRSLCHKSRHFRQSPFVRDFNHRHPARLQHTIQLCHRLIKMFQMMRYPHHHQPVQFIIPKRQFINISCLRLDFVTVNFFCLFKFRFRIIKQINFSRSLQIFIRQSPIPPANIRKLFHSFRQQFPNRHPVGLVLIFTPSPLPEIFFVIITIIIRNYFFTHTLIIPHLNYSRNLF